MKEEEIEQIKKMLNSKDVKDVVLAVKLISETIPDIWCLIDYATLSNAKAVILSDYRQNWEVYDSIQYKQVINNFEILEEKTNEEWRNKSTETW